MEPPEAATVVVRYGDMSTKSSRVRGQMEARLVENIQALLDDRGIKGDVEHQPTRPLVRTTNGQIQAATETAADAFGVVSASPALSVPPEKDAILAALAEAATACYEGGSFAVNARRSGTAFPYTSEQLAADGGSVIWDAVEADFEPEVNLDNPDLTFNVEVRESEAFVFFEQISGPGGLPLGSQRPVVALISGGIDSPVAAYEIMRTGCPIVPVYVDLGMYGGPDHRARAVETIRALERYAPNFEMGLRIAPGGETVELLADELEQGRMLAFRRFIYKVAEEIALDTGARGIVTGESIGQKSSQTAQNMSVTSPATDLPIYRPLVTMDKNVITERAKEIGTFEDSTIAAGCNRFAPAQAETNAHREKLRTAEPDDLFERAHETAEQAEIVDV